jgi:tetratricopeptide (TPR) repeat protein
LSTRLQILLVVVVLALAAAGTAVGVTLATRQSPDQPQAAEGKPPLGPSIPTPAEKEIRKAFAEWPKGSIATMERLGRDHPNDPVVQIYRGLALYWAGYIADAEAVLRKAKKVGRDTQWELQADNLLHPQFELNYPVFIPLVADDLLEEGSRLQQQGRQHSARRVYERAARASPNDCEAQVAAAVARFDKDRLDDSFSRLGPLTRAFPRCQAVRFYLALMLAWTDQKQAATAQFQKVRAMDPTTVLGRASAKYLDGNEPADGSGGTGSTTK